MAKQQQQQQQPRVSSQEGPQTTFWLSAAVWGDSNGEITHKDIEAIAHSGNLQGVMKKMDDRCDIWVIAGLIEQV